MGLRIGSSKVSAIVNDTSRPRGKYLVRFVDYDGTILKQAYLNKGQKIKVPANPTHDGLTFSQWVSPVTITSGELVTPDSDVTVGASYTTVSEQSEFYVSLNSATGLAVTLNMNGTKDWGDGTTNTDTSHTYTSAGDYVIKCNGTTMTTSSSAGLFGQTSSTKNCSVTKVHLKGTTGVGAYAFINCRSLEAVNLQIQNGAIATYAFYSCTSLKSLTLKGATSLGDLALGLCTALKAAILPTTITTIGAQVFRYCYTLLSITLPEGVTSVGANCFRDDNALLFINIPSTLTALSDGFVRGCSGLELVSVAGATSFTSNAFYGCKNLAEFVMNGSVTALGSNLFYNCPSLKSLEITGNVTSVDSRAFYYACALESVKLPGTITSIAAEAFSCAFGVQEYDFTDFTAIPTLANVSAFSEMNQLCVIKVPASLEASWKAASNWLTYANQIVGV